MLFVDVQFVSLIWFNLTWCSGNSLNSYIKSVNTVLFNLQNYFQKASSPLRGHQTRFKVHILSQPAYHRDHRRTREALHTKMKESPATNLNDYITLMLVACCFNSLKPETVICYELTIYACRSGRGNSKIASVHIKIAESDKVAVFIILKSKKCI